MIKAGVIQTKRYDSNRQGIEYTSKILRKLAKKETDLVCLPEQWLVENKISDFDTQFAEFKKISKDHGMTIVAGAFYEKQGHRFSITAPVIDDGEIIGRQEKIHPFGYERGLIRPSSVARVFKTKVRFGIVICYDMVFSGVVESMAKKGADIILAPSRIVRSGIRPWHIYVQARSLENRIPIVAANVLNVKFGGQSIIVDLVDKDDVMIPKIYKLSDITPSRVASFNLSKYRKSRFQRYQDKKSFS